MALADNTERIIEQMRLKTRDVTDQRILNDAFLEFEKSATHTCKLPTRNNVIRRFAGIAAAAAIAVVFWSVYAAFFNHEFEAPKQIFDNLAKTENVSIAMYNAVEEEPFQQIWASKPIEMTLLKTTSQNANLLTLWDISRNNKMISATSDKTAKTENMPHSKMLSELEKSVFYTLSLNRFYSIIDIPKNAKWTQIQSTDSNVFELSWHQKDTVGKQQYFKWRIILNENTKLLERTELYIKSNSEDQYKLDRFCVISHPQQDEIRTIILENFNIVISSPQYLPTGNI